MSHSSHNASADLPSIDVAEVAGELLASLAARGGVPDAVSELAAPVRALVAHEAVRVAARLVAGGEGVLARARAAAAAGEHWPIESGDIHLAALLDEDRALLDTARMLLDEALTHCTRDDLAALLTGGDDAL